jgi:arylformamidase
MDAAPHDVSRGVEGIALPASGHRDQGRRHHKGAHSIDLQGTMPRGGMMTLAWRTQPAALLEQHFNPRVAVPDFQQALARYATRSAAVRQYLPGAYDLRYGARPQQTFDLHRAAPPATGAPPLVLFLHGGYWRALDKRDHSFVAPLFVDAGVTLANVNYDLCPSVTLDVIVDEICEAVRYFTQHAADVGAAAQRLFLVGHSAGAHLVARMLAQDWSAAGLPADTIAGAVALSGLYEPEVVMRLAVNVEIGLTAAMAARHDCLGHPPQRQVPLLIAVGGAEPAGWIGQSCAYRDVCARAGIDVQWMSVEGANHFTLLEEAMTAGRPLAAAMLHLVTGQ